MIFSEFIKGILAGFGVGQIIALPPKFASLAVDNKVIYVRCMHLLLPDTTVVSLTTCKKFCQQHGRDTMPVFVKSHRSTQVATL